MGSGNGALWAARPAPARRVPPPTHLAVSACAPVPGCVQLLTSPVDNTILYVLFLLRYRLHLSVSSSFTETRGHCRAPHDGVRAQTPRSTPWSVAGNVR
ncbi:unnamed protein product [Pieris brassicae]|uniref:Uncharacterized protein n=1 Tax=Pieris brassicae TaxID=7116 RepID=A0A9P0TPQ8_PIEBR|nr:unnamed protein product [Pieris brassicae]